MSAPAGSPSSEPVAYTVYLEDRHAHLYAVEARFPTGGMALDLKLPVWTPGSYLVREFSRHVQELTCSSESGWALPVEKVDKATWRVDAREATRIVVRYRVYAYELTVRTAHLDDTHGFWNGACLFLYLEALRSRPARLTVVAPEGWRATTALEPALNEDAEDAPAPATFQAADYDELVDSPVEVGTHELVEFTACGRPHRIALWGRVEVDRARLSDDVTRIIEAARTLFADPLPYPHYTFLVLSVANGYGGLEHARSATLLTSPFSFAPHKKYLEFLELLSHEFFHLWNVKRIHPTALGRFDYQRETYTRSLWVVEGITSYYDRYLLVRAGLEKPEAYLAKLGEELAKIAGIPGRFRQSLEESSFDAWIKLYRPDENSVNSTVSYYLKGGVVALLLDLEIRSRSGGARSLDDVMRLLWRRHGGGPGFADPDFQTLAEEAAGLSLDDFFTRCVRGREELDPRPLLRTVGLGLESSCEGEDGEAAPAWLGATLKEDGGALVVSAVLDGGPAVAAGLYAQDEIVALDGYRVDHGQVKERLSVRRPGDRVTLTLFRRDQIRTVELVLGARPDDKIAVVPVRDPTDAERAAYQAWMNAALPPRE